MHLFLPMKKINNQFTIGFLSQYLSLAVLGQIIFTF